MPDAARRLPIVMLAALACGGAGDRDAMPAVAPPPSPTPIAPWFAEEARQRGLDFAHRTGARGGFYPPEIMGPGVALADLDQDGDLDALCVQGGATGPDAPRGAEDASRVYLNRLAETGALGFVPGPAIDPGAHGQGIAVGDYDGDGFPDVYLTAFGSSRLLRNRGGGRLEDVTGRSRTGVGGWSVPAVFLDYDRDGRLDLFVGRYLDFDLARQTACRGVTGAVDYCAPTAYPGLADRLFRNAGDGTFTDVTDRAGLDRASYPTLGAVAVDADGDGWLDLYVANDGQPNQLWMNRHDGSFRDEALLRGAALNGNGMAEAGMGVDAADVDGDLDLDLFVTNLSGETNTLYRNDGAGRFDDVTAASGLGPPSLAMTGFGTGFADFDGDAALDLFVANGAVRALPALAALGDPFPYHQPAQLFAGAGDGTFTLAAGRRGAQPLDVVGRGTALGDVDNDGDTDLLIGVDGASPLLLVNQIGNRRPWLGLRLVTGRRDALGAVAVVHRKDARPLLRRAGTDGSYASASDPRVRVGLGDAAVVERIEVRWPDGTREEFSAPPIGVYTTLRQGSGKTP